MKWSILFSGIVALVVSASCKEENKTNSHNQKRGLELSLGLPGAAYGVPGNLLLPLAAQPQPQLLQYGVPQGQVVLPASQQLIQIQPPQGNLFHPLGTYAPQAQDLLPVQLQSQPIALQNNLINFQHQQPQVLSLQRLPSAAYGAPRNVHVPQQLITNLLPPRTLPLNFQQGLPLPQPLLQGLHTTVLRNLPLAQPSIQYGAQLQQGSLSVQLPQINLQGSQGIQLPKIPQQGLQLQQGPLILQSPQLTLQKSQEIQLTQLPQQRNIPAPLTSLQQGLPLQQSPLIHQSPQFNFQKSQEIQLPQLPQQRNIPATSLKYGLPNNAQLQQGPLLFQSFNTQGSQQFQHQLPQQASLQLDQLNLQQRLQSLQGQQLGLQRNQPLHVQHQQPQINQGPKEQSLSKSNNGY